MIGTPGKGFSSNAVLYIRVSTLEQASGGDSIDTQTERLTQYCQKKGLNIITTITDAGVSGGKLLSQRQGGRQVLELLKAKKATHVVALKLDRLFRNAGDAIGTIEQWDKSGYTTHLIDFMGGDALDTRSGMGQAMLGMMAVFGQLERRMASDRTKEVMAHKKSTKQIYSPTPLGFNVQEGKLIENSEERKTIQLIFKLRGRGLSLRAIASELTNLGRTTKKGGKWYASTITAILNNTIHTSALPI